MAAHVCRRLLCPRVPRQSDTAGSSHCGMTLRGPLLYDVCFPFIMDIEIHVTHYIRVLHQLHVIKIDF